MLEARKRFADIAFILALMSYVVAGYLSVPFHPDEAMNMSMAREYFYLVQGQWDQLAYHPPIEPDTEPYLRMLNGSVNRLLIGFTWMLAGRPPAELPGIYAWAMPFVWNQQQGNVPSRDDLEVARLPSAILAALGVFPAFRLGWHLRLRSLAYPLAGLYAFHPIILLNGRRAMLEGSFMALSLAVIYFVVVMIVAEHSSNAISHMKKIKRPWRFVLLGILCGLVIAAKLTGVVVAASSLLAVFVTTLVKDDSPQRMWLPALGGTLLASVVMIGTWLALNPLYWTNPLAVSQASLAARTELLQRQSQNNPLNYMDFGQRLAALVTQPYLAEPQYAEAPNWSSPLDWQITAYQSRALDGYSNNLMLGLGLTVLAAIGLIAVIYDAAHRNLIAWAILLWAGLTALSSLLIPFAWQRYYLPWILVALVLAANGLGHLLVWRKTTAVPAAPSVN